MDKSKRRYLSVEERFATHQYVLLNCEEVQPILRMYENGLPCYNPGSNDQDVDDEIERNFTHWLKEYCRQQQPTSVTPENRSDLSDSNNNRSKVWVNLAKGKPPPQWMAALILAQYHSIWDKDEFEKTSEKNKNNRNSYCRGMVPSLHNEGSTPMTEHMRRFVSFDTHMGIIYAYRPPTPSNSTIELGLTKALAVYREWAGRLGKDDKSNSVILLNDKGVKFVEASCDTTLDNVMPFKPCASLLNLHPSLMGVAELVQVQVTRFKCGSLVVGFTNHHLVADGHSTSNFLVAWGEACREVMIQPLPLCDRTIFIPRNPPRIEYDHVGTEYMPKKTDHFLNKDDATFLDNIVVHKVHFTLEFLTKLKAKASDARPYSTFESLVAHLWRAITKARNLGDFETTHIRIAVDGRARLNPKVPNEYFGNLVLWAFPTTKVKDLLRQPLSYTAKLIHDAVLEVNNNYFRSFVDFANSKVIIEEDRFVPTADVEKLILCPNLEVDSLLRFPFYDLDFGTGCPYIFMPTFLPVEGLMFFLPSFIGDGSIDAFIALFQDNLATFKQICYSLD
nr:agmatine coumaroyltransferase-2-like [Ipomoea batatas]